MNASQLKYNHLLNFPDSHFFDRETMKFFNDKMSNFGVYKSTFNGLPVYIMYRKRELCKKHKYLRNRRYIFCANTFKNIVSAEIQEAL